MGKLQIKKASKKRLKLRLAIDGASGSGKTESALKIATGLAEKTGDQIVVIDTEQESSGLYSDKYDFHVIALDPPYTPERFIEAIKLAEENKFGIIVLDSSSHEWMGEGGCLEIVDSIGGNSYTAWRKVTPRHNKFINAMLTSSSHIIATMRSKTDYETGSDSKGRMTIQKQGTKAVQRDGVDYEFTLVFSLNQNHLAVATKDRTSLFDGMDHIPTEETGAKLHEWLNSSNAEMPTEEELAEVNGLIDKVPAEKQQKMKNYLETATRQEVQTLIKTLKAKAA